MLPQRSSHTIRKELEAGIDFQGSVHCIACGPEHCCYTSERYLYVWPMFDNAPMPSLELPFVPAAMAIHENRLLVVSSESIVVLGMGEDIVTEVAALAPRGTSMFPVVSSCTFSACGRLAVAYDGVSERFMILTGFADMGVGGEMSTNTISEISAQAYAVGISSGGRKGTAMGGSHADASPTFVVEHACFSSSHLYLVSRDGMFAAVPLDRFFGAGSSANGREECADEDDDTEIIPTSLLTMSRETLAATMADDVPMPHERHVTSFTVAPDDSRLYVGLDDGTLVVLTGCMAGISEGSSLASLSKDTDPSSHADPPYTFIAAVDLRSAFLNKRLMVTNLPTTDYADGSGGGILNISIDTSNVRCPLTDMRVLETGGGVVGIGSPLGFAFVSVSAPTTANSGGETNDGHSTVAAPITVAHIELNTINGDGIAVACAVGEYGSAIAWHAFNHSLVMRLFVPQAFQKREEDDDHHDGYYGDDLEDGGGPLWGTDGYPMGMNLAGSNTLVSSASCLMQLSALRQAGKVQSVHNATATTPTKDGGDSSCVVVVDTPAHNGLQQQRIPPPPLHIGDDGALLPLPEDDADDDETMRLIDELLRRNDGEPTRLGWAGVMHNGRAFPQVGTVATEIAGTAAASAANPSHQHHHRYAYERPLTANGFYQDDVGDDIIRAKRALGAKYTKPLLLVGAGMPTVRNSPSTAGGVRKGGVGGAPIAGNKPPAGPKPLVSATTGRPLQGSVNKPVTFGKPIRGSGYGASNNTPWSVQQEQKRKKAALEAARAKKRGPEIALGDGPPPPLAATAIVTPAIVGGIQYTYDVAKSLAPVSAKVKSNEYLAKPTNKIHSGAITSLTYNASATAIVTASSDATLHVLRCPVSAHKGEGKAIRGHTAPIMSVDTSLALSGGLVVSGGRDGCIGVWCPSKREAPYVMENVAGPKDVAAARFFYQDKLIVAAVGSQIKFFRYVLDNGGGDLDRGRNLSRLAVADQYRTDAQSVTALDCVNSMVSTVVVWSGSNKQFGIVDIGAQRTIRQTEEAHTRPIHSLVMAASNSRFASPAISNNLLHCCATAALDKTVKVWDLRVPTPCQVLSSHMNVSQQVGLCISPCGNFIVVGSEDRSAFVYDTRMSGPAGMVARLPMPEVVTACRYHPLEPVLALGTASGDVRLFGP